MLLAAPWIDTEPPFPGPVVQNSAPPPAAGHAAGHAAPPLPAAPLPPQNVELAELRRELDELKRAVKRRKPRLAPAAEKAPRQAPFLPADRALVRCNKEP
jgi:hypothetical protein